MTMFNSYVSLPEGTRDTEGVLPICKWVAEIENCEAIRMLKSSANKHPSGFVRNHIGMMIHHVTTKFGGAPFLFS
jgi:hypothetical protein